MRAESNIDFANNWTFIKGNHTLKAGADIRRVRDDLLQGNNNAAAGQFYFQENSTSAPGATVFNGSATGEANDMASMLFDVPTEVGQDTNSTFPCYRQTWLFFFASDKWQVGQKMTLDIGLRYELYPPATPRKAGGFVNYNPTNNGLVIAGLDGNPSNLGMQTDYKNFAPRLGLSYRVTEKTVLRTGFGVSYVPFVDNTYAYNYPIKTSTGYTNSPTYGPALNPVGGVINLVTGIPATPTVVFPSNGTLVESAANGTNGLSNLLIPTNFKNAYVSSWNAAIEQSLAHNMSFQIAYVANHGTRIDEAQNINLPSIYGQSGTYDPFNVLFNKTASVTQYFIGDSTNYESLQAQLTRRYNNGLAFNSALTWGKAQGYVTGAQDGGLMYFAGPKRRNYNLVDFDRKLNFEQTATYELPAGRGHRYFASGIGAYTVGGWKVSATVGAVSGLPFTITTTSVTPGTSQTVNQVNGYQVNHSVTRAANTAWFNPLSFTAPPGCPVLWSPSNPVPCAVGNTQRNQFRGPAYFNDNLSLFNEFPIYRESTALEARFDAFNMSNTPAFGLPNGTLGSNLGKITGTLGSGVGNVNGVGGPRVLQAAVKITF